MTIGEDDMDEQQYQNVESRLENAERRIAHLESELGRLADFILRIYPYEIQENESAVDVAIRLLTPEL